MLERYHAPSKTSLLTPALAIGEGLIVDEGSSSRKKVQENVKDSMMKKKRNQKEVIQLTFLNVSILKRQSLRIITLICKMYSAI